MERLARSTNCHRNRQHARAISLNRPVVNQVVQASSRIAVAPEITTIRTPRCCRRIAGAIKALWAGRLSGQVAFHLLRAGATVHLRARISTAAATSQVGGVSQCRQPSAGGPQQNDTVVFRPPIGNDLRPISAGTAVFKRDQNPSAAARWTDDRRSRSRSGLFGRSNVDAPSPRVTPGRSPFRQTQTTHPGAGPAAKIHLSLSSREPLRCKAAAFDCRESRFPKPIRCGAYIPTVCAVNHRKYVILVSGVIEPVPDHQRAAAYFDVDVKILGIGECGVHEKAGRFRAAVHLSCCASAKDLQGIMTARDWASGSKNIRGGSFAARNIDHRRLL